MHICLATHEFPPMTTGGISTYYVNLAKLLADDGHKVTVLTQGTDQDNESWSHDGVEVVRLGKDIEKRLKQLRFLFDRTMQQVCKYIAVGLAMRDWLRTHAFKEGIDVIEGVETYGSSAFLLDADLPPLLLTCHGSMAQIGYYGKSAHQTTQDNLFASLEVLSVALADEVNSYSPLNAKDWEAYTHRSHRFLLAPFVSSKNIVPERKNTTTPTGIVVGRLQNWKGTFELAEALRICKNQGVQLQIRWVGKDLPSPEPVTSSIKAYLQGNYPDLWDKVFLWEESLSPQQTRQAQANADFALVPSWWDTFNFSAIEAMSVGTPLIISDGAGAAYLCRNEVNSLVVPARNVQALAEAMKRLATDPVLREKLGKAGQKTVMDKFRAEQIVAERIAAYESAINAHKYRRDRQYAISIMNPIMLQLLRAFDRSWRTEKQFHFPPGPQPKSVQIDRVKTKILLKELMRRARYRLSLENFRNLIARRKGKKV